MLYSERFKLPALVDRVVWGAKLGFWIGAAYTAAGFVQYLRLGDRVLSDHRISGASAALVYMISGVVGGIFVGLARPAAKSKVGKALLAVAVLSVACFGFGLAMYGPPWLWTRPQALGIATSAIVLGIVAGMQF